MRYPLLFIASGAALAHVLTGGHLLWLWVPVASLAYLLRGVHA